MLQEPKQLVDTGEIGNTTTGDILFDGGNKINSVINALYNTFSDYRLTAVKDGVGQSVLHATGYYQKHPRSYYTTPIDMGSKHDINVNDGSITVRLPKAVLGEGVEIVNFNGSITDKLKLIILPNTSDDINTVANNLTITKSFTKVFLVCTRLEGTRGIWSYRTESLFGDQVVAISGTYKVNGVRSINIAPKLEFQSIKFLISGKSSSGFKTSEVIAYIDQESDQVYFSEYGVVKSDQELYTIDFSIDNSFLYINLVTTTDSNITIKSIESIKPGVAK